MPYGGGEIEIKVESNVSFDVTPNTDWIHYVSTKALNTSTVLLKIDENATYDAREGKVEIKQQNGSLKHTITINQAGRIAVTSVELNKTSLTLRPEETVTLIATVQPDNATDKTAIWSSSDNEVATVDENGTVSAIKDGSAVIVAKAGEKTAECEVVVSSYIVFKDAVFKAYCVENFDKDGDGEISIGDESDAITSIKCDDMGITSLKGIEWCRYLTELNCSSNQITELDVSNCLHLVDLRCGENQLASLDVRGLSELQVLFCYQNRLTELEVEGCSSILYIYCLENMLTRLDVDECVDLQYLDFSGNQIESIDLKNCVALKDLRCNANRLTTLDLSCCPKLGFLSCDSNQLKTLNISSCSLLYWLNCNDNQLTSLDVSTNSALEKVRCSNNRLTRLDFSGFSVLEDLVCQENQLSSLNVNGCTALNFIGCANNSLTKLDVSGCAALEYLYCNDNQISELVLIDCASLQSINCNANSLTSLDVSECRYEMVMLACVDNPALKEIWLKTGQTVAYFYYDADIATVKYKDTVYPIQAVDLGVVITREDGTTYTLYWADKNLGAITPEDNGYYYSWGETATKTEYTWSSYKWGTKEAITKYCNSDNGIWAGTGDPDGKTVLDMEDDVAHVKLGGSWRLPTAEEQRALLEQCTWTFITQNGKPGYEVKSNVAGNSNSIFLPLAGFFRGTHVSQDGNWGYYWSSTLCDPCNSYSLYLSSNSRSCGGGYRYDGLTVRPVTE